MRIILTFFKNSTLNPSPNREELTPPSLFGEGGWGDGVIEFKTIFVSC